MIRLKMTTALAVSGLMLAACSANGAATNAEANAQANAAEVTNTAAPAANEAASPATPVASGTGFSADFMVGKWSAIDEDCSATLEFRKDGTVETPIGPAKYIVDGDKLTFDYGDGSKPTVSTIKVLSPDRIEIDRASGGKETEKRC